MFAIIAAVILFFAAFGAHLGGVNLLLLGLAFWALHHAWAWTPWVRRQQ